jgi:FAD/FMN-containing dehydrogenase
MLARCHHLVVPLRDLPPVALLAVWRGRGEPPAALSEVVGGRPHAVALGTAEVNRFWEPRERMTETISKEGIPHKLDVSLPPTSLARFVSAVTAATAPHRLVVFGHLGDGNLHVNLLGPESSDESVDDEILQLVAVHGGSISAEHGIGRAKVRWLHLARSPEELEVARAIKRALDPAGVMNPAVLRPPMPRAAAAPL